MTHTYNPSIWEVYAGGSEIQGHLWLHSEFEASPGYMKSCIKKYKTKQNKNRTTLQDLVKSNWKQSFI